MGWVSKGEAYESEGQKEATATHVWDILARPQDKYVAEMIREHNLIAEERDGILADRALEWGRALATTERDYLYNLGVMARRQVVDYKSAGMVASMIGAYQRHLDRLEKARQAAVRTPATHVGTEGVREGFPALTVKGTRSFESDFGVRTLVRFQDSNGNVLVWWTGDPPDWVEENATVDVTATVKSHDHYNGFPQTVVTRVSLGLPKPKKGKKATA
jgi:hypothetical protein